MIVAIIIIMFFLILISRKRKAAALQNSIDDNLPRNGSAKRANQTLAGIFFNYKHENVNAWIKWIETQDSAIKDKAYRKLVEYLDQKLSEVGELVSEVLKAYVTFDQRGSAQNLIAYLENVEASWGKYTSPENHYFDALMALVKVDANEAEDYIINNLESSKKANSTYQYQIHLLNALTKLELNERIEKLFNEIFLNDHYHDNLRFSLLGLLEENELSVKIGILKSFLSYLLHNKTSPLNDMEVNILDTLMKAVKENLLSSNYDLQLWDMILSACCHPMMTLHTVDMICQIIADAKEQAFSPQQMMDLLNIQIKDPSILRGAIESKFSLSPAEIELADKTFMEGYSPFTRKKWMLEDQRSYHNPVIELQTSFKLLEHEILNNRSQEKLANPIVALPGSGDQEKIYLLRSIAWGHNLKFLYIDFEEHLANRGKLATTLEEISKTRPCIVYLDNIESFLAKDFDESDEAAVKKMINCFREIYYSSQTYFTANIPYEVDTIKQRNPALGTTLKMNQKFPMKMFSDINAPDDLERERIINSYQARIDTDRLASSIEYANWSLVQFSESMAIIELRQFIQSFFETSLYVYGKLCALDEYLDLKRYIEARNLPSAPQVKVEKDLSPAA